jgi:hypothetical protein
MAEERLVLAVLASNDTLKRQYEVGYREEVPRIRHLHKRRSTTAGAITLAARTAG